MKTPLKTTTLFSICLAVSFAVFGFSSEPAHAQLGSVPRLPTSGGLGLQGSAGVGFVDFTVVSPKPDIKIDRGTYIAASIERPFDFLHLYLTLGLSYLNAEGVANYRYRNLSSSVTFSANDVTFRSNVTDLSLGLKLKIIDNHWFRPYIEGGGLGGYHQLTYTSGQATLAAQGVGFKTKDVVMGTGYYGEGGLEAMFSERFGVRLAARQSHYSTKSLETLDSRPLRFRSETYYFSLLFGF